MPAAKNRTGILVSNWQEERLDAMRNMLKDRPVFVRDGDRADTFIISTKQESREERRQKVLDKLTAEERELLGV